MAEPKSLVVEVPAIHRPYDVVPIAEFFDDEDKERGWTTGHKLVAKGLATDTAEADSLWAYEHGIPDGVDYMVFVGKDRVWYVWRLGGRLCRGDGSLADQFGGGCWVARPRK